MIHDRSIIVDGVDAAYLEAGAQDAPVLLYLHGFFIKDASRPFLERVGEQFRVLAPDLPGLGDSSSLDTPEIGAHVAFVRAFVEKLALPRIVLAGYSYGGAVALRVAAEDPRVEALALLDPLVGDAESWSELAARMLRNQAKHEDAALRVSPVRGSVLADLRRVFTRHGAEAPRLTSTIDTAVHDADSAPQIRVPSLVVWGARDEVFPVEDGRALAARIPGAAFRSVDGTHDWPLVEPVRAADLVLSFLATVPPRP